MKRDKGVGLPVWAGFAGWCISVVWAILDINVDRLPANLQTVVQYSSLQQFTWPLSTFWRYYASNWPSVVPKSLSDQMLSLALFSALNAVMYGFVAYALVFFWKEFK